MNTDELSATATGKLPLEYIIDQKYRVIVHEDDIPASIVSGNTVAIDTETLGLKHRRDRLCLVQLCFAEDATCPVEQRTVHVVRFHPQVSDSKLDSHLKSGFAPVLSDLLTNQSIQKLFHFGRFDIGILYQTLGVLCNNVYCTRIASKFARTNTESHSLKTLCSSLLGVNLPKEESGSYWGADILTEKQLKYAAEDVLYLVEVRDKLQALLNREHRAELAEKCMSFLPTIVELEARGWDESIFAF